MTVVGALAAFQLVMPLGAGLFVLIWSAMR